MAGDAARVRATRPRIAYRQVVTVALSIGQTIADRYRLIRRIAVGGMGEVWEASDIRLARRVAVKVLKAELSGTAELLQRFRVEARITASLNHPGIAAVHDYGETAAVRGGPADTAYLVMELVEGEPLAAMIARRGRLSSERTLEVLEQAGHALQSAHDRGLVHRDVKPGNILITATGTVKLTDFGIAKMVDAAPVTRSGMVLGTAHYIAPEQAAGQEAGPAGDVYSLGVVGYECLTGCRPFLSDSAVSVAMMHVRDTPPPLPTDIPYGVRALIDATLVKDPRDRYGTGGEFAAAVAAVRAGRPLPRPGSVVLQGQPSRGTAVLEVPPPAGAQLLDTRRRTTPAVGPVGPQTPGQRSPRERKRSRLPLFLAGLLLLAALAVVVWALVNALDPQGGRPTAGPVSAPAQAGPPTSPVQPGPDQPRPAGESADPSATASPKVSVDPDDYRGRSAGASPETSPAADYSQRSSERMARLRTTLRNAWSWTLHQPARLREAARLP
jgi:eukaryotic-like serine/threonine-protein kinase